MKVWQRIWPSVARYLLLAVFLLAGAAKLMGSQAMAADFVRWGYPIWFMTFTGALEVGCAALLAIRTIRSFGTLLAVAILVGALATHLLHGEWLRALPAVVLLGVSGYLLRSGYSGGSKPDKHRGARRNSLLPGNSA